MSRSLVIWVQNLTVGMIGSSYIGLLKWIYIRSDSVLEGSAAHCKYVWRTMSRPSEMDFRRFIRNRLADWIVNKVNE